MENKTKVTRCAKCKAIVLDGTMIQKGDYKEFNGYDFLETILSRECGERYYGKAFANRLNFIRESCRH